MKRARGREAAATRPLVSAGVCVSPTLLPLPPSTQIPPTGLGAVLLDALAEREWVREDDLFASLGLHAKPARRALRYLEGEQLVAREHRKEAARPRAGQAAVASSDGGAADSTGTTAADGASPPSIRAHIHSYAALDWPRALDVLRLRRHALRAGLTARAARAAAVLRYDCPSCGAAHDTLAAARLIDPRDGEFHCDGDHCGGAVLVAAGGGDRGADAAAARSALEAADAALQPLDDALAAVDAALAGGAAAPDFGPLGEWAMAVAQAAARGRGGGGGGGRRGVGDPDVAVELGATVATDAAAAGPGAPKELPPWLRAAGAAAAAADAAGDGHARADAQAEYAAAYAAEVERRAAEIAAGGGGRDAKRPRVDEGVKAEAKTEEAPAAADEWTDVVPPPAAKAETAEDEEDDEAWVDA